MNIRKATEEDLSRIAEIFVFNNRINYFPIFKQEDFSFGELQVVSLIENYFGKTEIMDTLFVAEDNGIIKGFMEIRGTEIGKLYVEPCFQSGVWRCVDKICHSKSTCGFFMGIRKIQTAHLYNCHGFIETGEKEYEEGTTEYLLKLVRRS
ncbi:MAG: GNAT family N-acetyltransferase [Roseburia sp.]